MGPTEDMKGLVLDFLCSSAQDKKLNWLSLEVLCSSEARAVKLLIGMAPKAVLPYAMETFKGDNKKVIYLQYISNIQNFAESGKSVLGAIECLK